MKALESRSEEKVKEALKKNGMCIIDIIHGHIEKEEGLFASINWDDIDEYGKKKVLEIQNNAKSYGKGYSFLKRKAGDLI